MNHVRIQCLNITTCTHQSPHRVIVKTNCCAPKAWPTLQLEEGNAAVGVPQVDVSTELPELRLDGTLAVFQNQMLRDNPLAVGLVLALDTHKMPEVSNWVAQTPPPAAANALPTLFLLLSATTQPATVEQSVAPSVPLCEAPGALVQPVLVWSAISDHY